MYLAGEHEIKNGSLAERYNAAPYILESFFYAENNIWIVELIPKYKGFLLDSGAFTFMENANVRADWESYVERYAEFILHHKIDQFFELDIDSVVGIKEVEKLRRLLERKTGKQPIPVWHKSRGKDYWLGMIKDYPYVSIGGIVSKEITRAEQRFFPWFVETAHEAGAKIHALGYTNLTGITKYAFDSVDSTSWLYGNRSGTIYNFNGKTITGVKVKPGKRLRSREAAIHNFGEWVKFANYLDQEKI